MGVRTAAGGGAAGSRYVDLTFAHRDGSVCTLSGYPGVSFVAGADGTQLGVPAVRRKTRATTVRLGPGDRAAARLQIVNTGSYDAARCQPRTADGLRVYPPGSKQAAFVPLEIRACRRDLGQSKQLTVSPVEAAG